MAQLKIYQLEEKKTRLNRCTDRSNYCTSRGKVLTEGIGIGGKQTTSFSRETTNIFHFAWKIKETLESHCRRNTGKGKWRRKKRSQRNGRVLLTSLRRPERAKIGTAKNFQTKKTYKEVSKKRKNSSTESYRRFALLIEIGENAREKKTSQRGTREKISCVNIDKSIYNSSLFKI